MYKFSPYDVNTYNDEGYSPLYYACFWSNYAMCERLLDLGAKNRNVCDKNKLNYPLHLAFKCGNIALIMLLIESGSDLNSLNIDRVTPIAYGSKSLLKKLNMTQATCTRRAINRNWIRL